MKKSIYILFLTAIALTISSCGGGGTNSSVSSNVKKILAIGDSMGAGFGGTNPWPRLVQEKSGVTVINNSIPGRQARGSVSLVQNEIATHQPSHLIILLGTNDANNGSVDSAVSSMKSIVEAAKSAGVIPIVATLPPVPAKPDVNTKASGISGSYGSLGVTIANVRDAFRGKSGLFQSDGFHPNNAGQELIADAFIAVL
jgi:acyl-CoA thioesterase-1